MQKLLTLAVVLLSSCGPTLFGEPECVSFCGMRLQNAPMLNEGQHEGWTCETLQRVEQDTIGAFNALTYDDRLHQACKGLFGVRIVVSQAPTFYSVEHEGSVYGQTYCGPRLVEVGNDLPELTAITHELAHILQNCSPLGPNPDNDPHANWWRDGIYQATDAVNAQGEAYERANGWL